MTRAPAAGQPTPANAGSSTRPLRFAALLAIAIFGLISLLELSPIGRNDSLSRLSNLLRDIDAQVEISVGRARGYVLLQDERLRVRYEASAARARSFLLAASALVEDEALTGLDVTQLSQTSSKLLATHEQAIAAQRRGDNTAALDTIRSASELAPAMVMSDTIRPLIAEIDRQVQVENWWWWLAEVTTLLLVSAVLLIGVIYFNRYTAAVRSAGEQARLRNAIWMNSDDAYVLWDARTANIVDVNPAAESLLQRQATDLIGRQYLEFIAARDIPTARETAAGIGDIPLKGIQRHLVRGDGSETLVDVSISSMMKVGADRLALVTLREMGERERAARDIAVMKAVEDSAPSGVLIVSRRGRIIHASRKFCDMVGWTSAELVGTYPPRPYWPPEMSEHLTSMARTNLEERSAPYGAEIVMMKRSGERFTAQYLSVPFRYMAEDGWIAHVIDISEKKRLEADLAESQRLEGIGKLTGGVVHDFNNLMNIVQMSSQALKLKYADDPGIQKIAEMIATATHRAAGITRSLLAVARQQPLNLERVDIGAVVRDHLDLLRAAVGSRIALETGIGEGALPVIADSAALLNAILNVGINAKHAMPEGGSFRIAAHRRLLAAGHPALLSAGLPEANYVVVELADTGPGMPADVMRRAFEPFFTTKPKTEGSGLGLATVYGFCRQCGGTAELENRPEGGLTVRLILPAAPEAAKPAALPAAGAAPSGTTARQILIVDDEPAVAGSMAEFLRLNGCVATVANSGEEALQLVRTRAFDVVFTDYAMPGMSGSELAAKMRDARPALKIVMMTGYKPEGHQDAAWWKTLLKPVQPAEILEIVAGAEVVPAAAPPAPAVSA